MLVAQITPTGRCVHGRVGDVTCPRCGWKDSIIIEKSWWAAYVCEGCQETLYHPESEDARFGSPDIEAAVVLLQRAVSSGMLYQFGAGVEKVGHQISHWGTLTILARKHMVKDESVQEYAAKVRKQAEKSFNSLRPLSEQTKR